MKVRRIRRRTMRMILAAAKDSYPNEFSAALRARDGVVTELILVPGTISGERGALMRLHMLPIDFSIVGSAHSHPSGAPEPSEADLEFFSKFGYMHIIAAHPFRDWDWAAYDPRGHRIALEVI